MELAMDTSVRGGSTVLALTGDIDLHTAPALRDQLAAFEPAAPAHVVVDLSGVGFLDSSALGALVVAQRAYVGGGGSLALACPRPHVTKVFRITRLTDVIPVFDTVDEAVAARPQLP